VVEAIGAVSADEKAGVEFVTHVLGVHGSLAAGGSDLWDVRLAAAEDFLRVEGVGRSQGRGLVWCGTFLRWPAMRSPLLDGATRNVRV
jgi:hypothetical protein